MKKFSLILTVAALFLGACIADAGPRFEVDLGATDALGGSAIDTTAVSILPANMAWGDASPDTLNWDMQPGMWFLITFTSAGIDSIAFFLDYYDEAGNLIATDTQTLEALATTVWMVYECTPGFSPAGVRARISNTDSGAAATTVLQAKIIALTD